MFCDIKIIIYLFIKSENLKSCIICLVTILSGLPFNCIYMELWRRINGPQASFDTNNNKFYSRFYMCVESCVKQLQ